LIFKNGRGAGGREGERERERGGRREREEQREKARIHAYALCLTVHFIIRARRPSPNRTAIERRHDRLAARPRANIQYIRQSGPDSELDFRVKDLAGDGHTIRRCRRVTFPESYITKYTTYTKMKPSKVFPLRSEANISYVRQSGPDFDLGFRVKDFQPFEVVPSSLGSGPKP